MEVNNAKQKANQFTKANGNMHPKLQLVTRHGNYEGLMDLLNGEDSLAQLDVMPPEVIVACPERVLQGSIHAFSEGNDYLIEESYVHSLAQLDVMPPEVIVACPERVLQGSIHAFSEGNDYLIEADDVHSQISNEQAVEDGSLIQVSRVPIDASTNQDSLLQGVTFEGDTALHVVAISGDNEKFLESAKVIYDKAKHLLHVPNKMGDTPLHCAARATNVKMVSCLVSLAKGEDGGEEIVKKLIRRKNKLGETALHQAIRSANESIIDKLMSQDPYLASIPNKGMSPLYLAISLGRINIVQSLLHRTAMRLSYSGPDKRNVLHVAVFRGEALPLLLEWGYYHPFLMKQRDQNRSASLLEYLTEQQDRYGSTPLHLAASLEGWNYSPRWSHHIWCKHKHSPTTLLLSANKSAVYQADNKGWYPIHVAASNGRLKVVIILLKMCPDCATLRDREGKTFLHVAVEKERHDIVAFACKWPLFASILNMQDCNGDTALHLAVRVGALSIFNCLFQNQHVHVSLANKDGLTPRGLSWCMIPPRFYFRSNPRSVIHQTLIYACAQGVDGRLDLFYEKYDEKKDENKESENMTNAAQVLGIASVLIATVTFAAAFTLPGGYRADDHANRGTPTLAGSYAFDAFVISNTLAFICSLLATISLLYSGVSTRDFTIRFKYYNISVSLLQSSARSLIAAFAMGIYTVLAPVAHWTAAAVCTITFATLFYGNMEIWQILIRANTLYIRLGIWAAMSQVRPVLECVLIKFWSYIIIFILPAILKILKTT